VRPIVLVAIAVAAAPALTALSGPSQTRPLSPVLRADTIARVARQRTRSVVFLHTISKGSRDQESAADLLTPSPQLPRIQEGLGSGVIIDVSGLILTNAHVIEGADVIHVRTPDGDDGEARVVGTDPDSDLALLRADTLTGLQAAPLGDSDRLQVGDWVVAVGSPFGLHHTVTAGIISAKARGMDDSGLEYLQTDAAINPGNSGGALLDLNGALVGITSAMLSQAGGNIGLNFAIPVNAIREVLPQLRTGTVTHGWIGITALPLSRTVARTLGIESGFGVIGVAENGPAARAGIRVGDVVLGIGGASPAAPQEIYRRIRDTTPGATVVLRVWRNKERSDVAVEVATRPRPRQP
jgi:serine protease Do